MLSRRVCLTQIWQTSRRKKKRLISSFPNTKMPRESGQYAQESEILVSRKSKKTGSLLKVLQLSKFSFTFQLRKMSENFWVPTCSEELITSDKELNTKDYVELDNHSMQSRLWFLFLSATVSALWHPCTSERSPALFFTGHSQARERVPRKNVGCTAIQSGLTLQGVPVHSHRAQALSPISSSVFTTFTFSPEPTLLFLTPAPLSSPLPRVES